MEWERLPNGKWKPKKVFTKSSDGKFDWDDPRYIAKMKKQMQETVIWCEFCKDYYNLLAPCIHHLPDTYANFKKKKEYYSKPVEYKSDDTLD